MCFLKLQRCELSGPPLNCLCRPIMRSNCCCYSHSTTMQVSCKKGSISSAARTQACSPPLMLLLWDVAGFRGRGLEFAGVIDTESMHICCPHENARPAFLDFSTLKPGFKKVRLQDPCGRSAKMMQNVRLHKRAFSLWTAPRSQVVKYRWPTPRHMYTAIL